jgi:uridylate kinase
MKRVIVKLSGEALAGNSRVGIDYQSVNQACQEISELIKSGYQVGIVCGAGNMWRGRDAKDLGMDRSTADYMGMLGTVLNSLAIKSSLENLGHKAKVLNAFPMPKVCDLFTSEKAKECLEEGYVLIFSGGTGNPFFSTDTTAALRACEINATTILMAKNGVSGVYDSDPNKNPNAQRFSKLTYRELIERELQVMDLTASTLLEQNDIQTIVFDMNQKGNINNILKKPELGTVITK